MESRACGDSEPLEQEAVCVGVSGVFTPRLLSRFLYLDFDIVIFFFLWRSCER